MFQKTGAVLMSGLVLLAVAAGAGADEAVPFEQVPLAVKEAVKARWSNAENLSARAEGDADDRHYRLSFTVGGRKSVAHFSQDGKLRRSVESVKSVDVPSEIRDAVAKRYPGAMMCMIKRVADVDVSGMRVQYQFKTQSEDERRAFVFTAAGKLLSEQLEEDGDREDD